MDGGGFRGAAQERCSETGFSRTAETGDDPLPAGRQVTVVDRGAVEDRDKAEHNDGFTAKRWLGMMKLFCWSRGGRKASSSSSSNRSRNPRTAVALGGRYPKPGSRHRSWAMIGGHCHGLTPISDDPIAR